MPISSDPSDTLPYVLQVDRKKPVDQQATFDLRFLTSRESRRVEKLVSVVVDAEKASDDDAMDKAITDIFGIGLVGWKKLAFRGQPVPSGAVAELACVLSDDELWELIRAIRVETRLSETSRKNSVSAPVSAPEQSAAPADPGGASTSRA